MNQISTLIISVIALLTMPSFAIQGKVEIISEDSIFHCERNLIKYSYVFSGDYYLKKSLIIEFRAKIIDDSVKYYFLEKSDSLIFDDLMPISLIDSATDSDIENFKIFLSKLSSYKGESYRKLNGECQNQIGYRSFGWGKENELCGYICCIVCSTKETAIYPIENDLWIWFQSKFKVKRFEHIREAGNELLKDDEISFIDRLKEVLGQKK